MRTLLLATAVALSFVSFPSPVTPAASAATNLSRTEIRAMPIHDRPNRTGHFYGNTVRRRSGR